CPKVHTAATNGIDQPCFLSVRAEFQWFAPLRGRTYITFGRQMGRGAPAPERVSEVGKMCFRYFRRGSDAVAVRERSSALAAFAVVFVLVLGLAPSGWAA